MFGDRNPEIAALLPDQSFAQLICELFATEQPRLPSKLPHIWNKTARLDLVAPDGTTYRAGTRLVLIPAIAELEIADLLRPALDRYVEIAAYVSSELRTSYSQTVAAERFTWSQASHSVLCGLFLDLAMGREVIHSGVISRGSTGDTVVWAFQDGSAENAYGVSAIAAELPQRALFAELWHYKSRRSRPLLSRTLVGILTKIAQGEPAGSAKEILYLKHLGVLRTEERSLRLQIPAFGPSDTQRLLEPLTEGAKRLVGEAIIQALELLEDHRWWGTRVCQEAYRHAAIRLILEYGMDRVISAGICDPFPEFQDTSTCWGRWLWEELDGPTTIMPHLALSISESVP